MKTSEAALITRLGSDGDAAALENSETHWCQLGLGSFAVRRDTTDGDDPAGLYHSPVTLAMPADTTFWNMPEITIKSPAGPKCTMVVENRDSTWMEGERITTANSSPPRQVIASDHRAGVKRADARWSVINSAVAEIVGGYCQDLKDCLFDIVLSSGVSRPEVGWWHSVARILRLSASNPPEIEARITREARYAKDMVDDLHRFVSEFYEAAPPGTDAGASTLSEEAEEARLRHLIEVCKGGASSRH